MLESIKGLSWKAFKSIYCLVYVSQILKAHLRCNHGTILAIRIYIDTSVVYVESISAANGSVISFVVIHTALFMTSNYCATVSETFIALYV